MSLGSIIQGVIGNPFGSAVSGAAFATINEALAGYRSSDGGIARPSRYEVVILPPTGSPTNPFTSLLTATNGARDVSLKCENISFPGRNIDTTPDTNIYGPTREIATGFSFADITATFQCSSEMNEKIFFERWQEASFNINSWAMRFYKEYVGEIRIFLLDEQDQRRYGVKLWECFPKTIAEQSLNYATINEQLKLSVTFSYRYWTDLKTSGGVPAPLGERIVDNLRNQAVRRLTAQTPAVTRILGNIIK